MPLDTYDFNPLFGWVEDRFGVSWQLMWVGDEPARAKVAPAMMFVGAQCGRAEEAMLLAVRTLIQNHALELK